jgi:hypothetical protein
MLKMSGHRTQEAPEAMEEIETVDLTVSAISEELSSHQPMNVPKEVYGGPNDQL